MGKVNSLRMDMQQTSSYRLGWFMAERGKPRPDQNIITWYRLRGLRWGFATDAQLDAAERRHSLMLMGWDDYHAADMAA